MRIRQIARDAAADSVFALRSFRRAPGWTFVTLLTIALGVVALGMLVVSLAACARPLLRAPRIDPVLAMRIE